MPEPLNNNILTSLREIVGDKYVLLAADDNFEKYEHDETEDFRFPPQVVVLPENTEQVQDIVRLAAKHNIPIVPRGGGTGLSGGALATQSGICLSLERMNRILEIDERDFFISVQPGVITQHLQEAVEEKELFYPPDPASRGSCTIGGNIAENAGGPRALKYGVTKDYVYGLKVVLANGELTTWGGKRLKDVTGYNMVQLFVGSEGTLGIVTEITLKLIALPKYRRTMMVPFNSLQAAAESVPAIMSKGVVPCALELLEQDAMLALQSYSEKPVKFSDKAAVLLIEIDGNHEEALDSELEMIGTILEEHGAQDIFLAQSPAHQTEMWETRRAVAEAVKSICPYKEEDTVVPRSKMPELILGVHEICDRWGIKVICYGHAGDGNVHCNILKDKMSDELWENGLHEPIEEIFKLTVKLGGTISGEHGIGYVQSRYLPLAMSEAEIAILRQIKKAIDPVGIMNPGKMIL